MSQSDSHRIDGVDLSNYKAFGKFSPLYDSVFDQIYATYDLKEARLVHVVAVVISRHSGPLGVSYRLSLRRIMQVARVRHENARRAVEAIVYELGWIREHRQMILSRGTEMVDWQFSPLAYYIPHDRIQQAVDLWNRSQLPARNELFAASGVSAVETQSESESDSENQIQNQKHNQRSNQIRNAPVKRGRWIEVPADKCRAPLQNAKDERSAQLVISAFSMSPTQARQLVASYGWEETQRELIRVQELIGSGARVKNPGAMLRTYLRTAHGRQVAPELEPFLVQGAAD